MLLDGVVPTADGWLADGAGEALPLAPGHREPWWLLAAAGAAPATVSAEWSPSGLRPLAAWVDGRHVPAGPPVPESGVSRPAELPGELLAPALVGTARRPWTGSLLEDAAVALLYRRAGVMPSGGHPPVPPAPAETDPGLPAAAGARLLRILSGATPGGTQAASELLAQWLDAAVQRGGRVPPEALPALLDAGRRNSTIAAVRGPGGRPPRDLAGRDAGGLVVAAGRGVRRRGAPTTRRSGTPVPAVSGWPTCPSSAHRDPPAARDLLASAWAAEAPDDRARLLTVARHRAVPRRRRVPRLGAGRSPP